MEERRQRTRESDDDILLVEDKVIGKYDHIQRCINALKLCLVTFPQNYKALYRLAYYNNTFKFYKDCSRARNYMLRCDFWGSASMIAAPSSAARGSLAIFSSPQIPVDYPIRK